MSVTSQAVLPGSRDHLSVADLVSQCGAKVVNIQQRYRPEHWELAVSQDESTIVIDVFLNSWAAEDYKSVMTGPSTLLVASLSPAAADLFRRLAASANGWYRRTDSDEWQKTE